MSLAPASQQAGRCSFYSHSVYICKAGKMKIAPIFGVLGIFGFIKAAYARPVESDAETGQDKDLKAAQIYVLGSLYNAAVSEDFSKTQVASDRNESEWNTTDMFNKVTHDEFEFEDVSRGGRVLIYAGGDAANVAIAYQASEAQAAENEKHSGYNAQTLALGGSSIDDYAEYAENEEE